ncbi:MULTISPECIES: TRAP transporter substrate-binding protein [Geobacillus]|uniref:TRAP transporter substrate-binding protein n=2 Tax=Geobacillus thermodenitrificans TaxID=33940 RepID=A0ABY9Q7C3_GEOTD|nr:MULTISPECIES: TRAP transporter substrate-binding protein [Geobacillus]NNU88070.1 TRAP transporter substrate-binding protein [Geobacillus sp. MR]ARA99541.1 C4-dicarboxylate ABC transporter substrate-binding protein [Geobacillus thermodenitrificans]ATO35741.1 C4-dicarboxylate ABC transporter substrate-binding protein [Geobacillus thermodenitrificans]ATO38914.1 C4-dicarboxylate ABC transporter substrate-binding protein [Geobacillus thermodenitrificans]MED0662011.1 C4-dicarboxylate ABC transpor
MKRRAILFLFFTVLLLLLSGCGSSETTKSTAGNGRSGGAKVIKVANYFAENHPQNVALREKFKKIVEEKSRGSLKVEIYPNSALGAEQEFYNGVRNGTIEMGIPGLIMQNDIAKMGVPEWPFLFKDFEHVKNVLNGPIGEEITAELETKHGVVPLAWSANGFRMFSSNRTIDSIKDFKGLRLRMPNIPNYITIGKLLGANVTPLPISEVFTALEQKVVDGQDNPIATLRASGWYEVQTDVLESKHMFSPNVYVVNKKFWDSLTDEQRKIIQEAAKEAADYEFELMEKSYEEDKKFLQEHGIKFTTPDDKFVKQMEEAVQPLYDELFKKYDWAEDLYKRIKAEAK